MNAPEPADSFEAARRRHLIEATIETLADVGFKAASLAEIARRANVSTGLFAHYFGDKDGLLEATLRFMAARLGRSTAARLRAATSPRDRLLAVAEAALAEEEFDRRTSAVWLAFWGQIMHSAPYRRVQSIYQRRMLSNLRHGLAGLVPPERADAAARLIAATIDGLWLQSHATEGAHDGRQARATVRDLVDVLIGSQEPPVEQLDVSNQHAPPALGPVVRAPAGFLGERQAVGSIGIDAAAARAKAGAAAWVGTPPDLRRRIVARSAAALAAEAGAFARMDAQNAGRGASRLREHDLPSAIRALEGAAEMAGRPDALRIAFDALTFGYESRPASGIVCAMGELGAPLLSACRQASRALATGDAVLFAPAAETPQSADALAALLASAGVPDGLFAVLPGGGDALRRLRAHPAVTSAPRARAGPRAAIVLADADVNAAAHAVLRGAGRAFSETVVHVHEDTLDRFGRAAAEIAASLTVGDPREDDAAIGALPSSAYLDAALAALAEAQAGGARTLCGGHLALGRGRDAGAFLQPTVVSGCSPAMAIARGDLFAPVVPLVAFRYEDELVGRLRRPTEVAVFGAETAAALRLVRRLDAWRARVNIAEDPSSAAETWLAGGDPSKEPSAAQPRRTLVRYTAPPVD